LRGIHGAEGLAAAFLLSPCLYLSCMSQTLILRRARPADLSAVDVLLSRSYPRLLAADYPPSVLVLAVPRIARAQPALLASGTYFLAEDGAGRVVGAGGWTPAAPGRAGGLGRMEQRIGHVRHVATDPDMVRQGVGRQLMTRVMQDARAVGVEVLECASTRTAVPFYAALGFRTLGDLVVSLGPGVEFAAVRMMADLR
jgi:GNAT superfamily N-acetyltransferase